MGQHYNEKATATKQIQVLAIPERIIADASTPQEIGARGKLLRVKGVAGEFIVFGKDDDVVAPSAATPNALEMEDGYFIIRSTDAFVRTSVAVRIEVIPD